MGHVELEDDHVIVVRTLDDKVESFLKDRVLGIVRLVDPKPGQTGVVYLREGQTREGIILEDAFEYVLVEIEGVRAKLKRETVDHVALEPTFEERYETFKKSLSPDAPARHLDFCRWLVHEHRYELARQELEDLLLSSKLPEAQRLLTVVEAQLALLAAASEGPGSASSEDEDAQSLDDANIISSDDVNLIRVYEIDFGRPPRLAVRPETVTRLITQYGSNALIPSSEAERLALYRAEPLEIVELMFNLRARDLYGEIEVLSEPHALNMFRQRVHDTWLINNCATSQCHGGADAGRLFLQRRHFKDARVRYSNLLTLERLELSPDWRLVNYDRPLDSLIIQYGLPREATRLPHPEARGWRAVFRHQDDRMVRETVAWMESMLKPRPDYPVEFQPMTLPPASSGEAPSDEPAGRKPR